MNTTSDTPNSPTTRLAAMMQPWPATRGLVGAIIALTVIVDVSAIFGIITTADLLRAAAIHLPEAPAVVAVTLLSVAGLIGAGFVTRTCVRFARELHAEAEVPEAAGPLGAEPQLAAAQQEG